MSNAAQSDIASIQSARKSKIVILSVMMGASVILEVHTRRKPQIMRNPYSDYFSVWEPEATIHLPGICKEVGSVSLKIHDVAEKAAWFNSVKELNEEFYWTLDKYSSSDSHMADSIIHRRNLLATSFAVGGICTIDRIEVNAEHRSNGYGMAALRMLLRWHMMTHGVATGFLKAFPLQFAGNAYDSSRIKPEFLSAKRHVRTLYAAQLGAVVVTRGGFMLVDMVETMGCDRADLIERRTRAQSTRRARDLIALVKGRIYGGL
ncbi:hypothetical protein [Thiomonas sp.]